MMYFKLLSGVHSHGDKVYNPGDIIESGTDLEKRFNVPGSLRFQRIREEDLPRQEDHPSGNQGKTALETLTVNQLRKLAEEYEIDLADATKKDDIIGILAAEGVEP